MTTPRLAHKVIKPTPYFSDADHGTDVAKTIERAKRRLRGKTTVVHVGRLALGKLERS